MIHRRGANPLALTGCPMDVQMGQRRFSLAGCMRSQQLPATLLFFSQEKRIAREQRHDQRPKAAFIFHVSFVGRDKC